MQTFTGVISSFTRRSHLITASVLAAAVSGYSVWRYSNGDVPGDHLLRAYGIVITILVITWLISDPRIPARQRPSFDHGMFVWMTFPILAACHMYAAHRWRGILIVIGLLGLIVAPNVALAIAYIVR
jgi:hypothetical protein